ncbi:MAG TPA: hypothetical protein VK479_16200 [Micropepsaceae bacterium]|jgi:NADH:ubiquinone oxidoreductase subunit K|nr:hypothetical protein [Micropepsaceae bacterium]
MSAIEIALILAGLLLCIPLAGQMAKRRGCSVKLWMWLAVFLGPLPLVVLAFVPKARH